MFLREYQISEVRDMCYENDVLAYIKGNNIVIFI